MTTKTIILRKPIKYGKGDDGKTLSEITVREPTAGEYESAEKVAGEYGMAAALTAVVCGLPIDAIDQMYSSQIDEAEQFMSSFGGNDLDRAQSGEDEFVLQLLKPIRLTDDDTALNAASLTLSEPTNLQRRKARSAGGAFAAGIALISMNAGVPKKSVRALSSRDFLAAISYFNGFQPGRSADSDD